MSFPTKHKSEIKTRALAMLRAGKRQIDIANELGVPSQTVSTWYHRNLKTAAPKPAKAKKLKTRRTSATVYLAKQLEIVSKMLRAKLPELARFSLTTSADGETTVEYTVRQLTEVSGSVKL